MFPLQIITNQVLFVFIEFYKHYGFCLNIVNRPRNGYETVDNIKVVSTDSLKQLEVANKVDTSQTKLHVYCKHESFVLSLDDLDNISILLITHLFNEVSIFTFKFKKKHNQSGSKYTQNMYRDTG